MTSEPLSKEGLPLQRQFVKYEHRNCHGAERPTVSQIWARTKLIRLKTNTETHKEGLPLLRQFVKYEHRNCHGAERPSCGS